MRGKPDKLLAGGGHLSELVRGGMLPRGAARTSGAFLTGTVSAFGRSQCPDRLEYAKLKPAAVVIGVHTIRAGTNVRWP